jgi:hypothetical protein
MKCFNHPDQDAVATCKRCGKFLCRSCCLSGTTGICCSPECQFKLDEEAAWLDRLRQRSQRRRKGPAVFLVYLCAAFLLVGFLAWVFWMGVTIRGIAPDLFK